MGPFRFALAFFEELKYQRASAYFLKFLRKIEYKRAFLFPKFRLAFHDISLLPNTVNKT